MADHARRAGGGAVHGRPPAARTTCRSATRVAGGRGGPPQRRRLRSFDWNDRYNLWSGADRRHVPGAGLLRMRPEPGAALPHRQVHRAEPAEPAVQRHGQDPDAVLHPVHRRDGVRVLHVREAAAAVPPGASSRSIEQRRSVTGTVQKQLRHRVSSSAAAAEDYLRPPAPWRVNGRRRRQRNSRRPEPSSTRRTRRAKRRSSSDFNDTNFIFLSFVTHYLPGGSGRPDPGRHLRGGDVVDLGRDQLARHGQRDRHLPAPLSARKRPTATTCSLSRVATVFWGCLRHRLRAISAATSAR